MVRAVSLIEISDDLWKLDGGTISGVMKLGNACAGMLAWQEIGHIAVLMVRQEMSPNFHIGMAAFQLLLILGYHPADAVYRSKRSSPSLCRARLGA